MAMRRRIKVGVNLTAAKRKPKTEVTDNVTQETERNALKPSIKAEEPITSSKDNQETSVVKVVPKTEPRNETNADDTAFKCPPKVDFNRSNSYTTTHTSDEINQNDIDDGAQVMQMDLQRTANGFPMSPSKTQRQRIKPTPIFGQRRNSLVGPPASPLPLLSEDATEPAASPQRRERHYSGSLSHAPAHNYTVPKPPGHGTGRIRTESTCSVFSDSHLSTTSKSRKADEHNTHRTHTRRDFEARFSNGVPDKSSLKMFDLIYYNPITNPMEQKPKIEEIKTETKEEETSTDADLKNNENSAIPVPQLKLNAKGELILDDKSLEIETTAEQEARKVLAKSSLIYLDENTGMNGFYKRQKRTRDWAPDETIRFYRCLQTIGTDFSMMCQLFPKRTRRDLKLKFKKEERCNGALINKALLHPNSFNIQDLRDQFEIEDRQREEEERTKTAHKSIQYKRVNIKTSKAARALKNADDIYNQELRDVEAKKKKRPRKMKNAEKNETEEGESKEKAKRRRETKKNKELHQQELVLDVPTSENYTLKHEPQETDKQHILTANHSDSITSHSSTQIQLHEPMTVPVEQPTHAAEYIELFPTDETDYDSSARFQYEEDNDDIQEEYYFLDDAEAADSRTFVNMDSGNVTLIRDNQTMYNNVDGPSVQIINNNELTHSDMTTLSNTLTHEPSLVPFISSNEILYPDATEQHRTHTENVENVHTKEIENIFSTETEKNEAHESEQVTTEESQNINTEEAEKNVKMETEKIESTNETSPAASPSSAQKDETEIMKILEDIANGSLVVVSTYNPASPDDQINEIYMLDSNTGELCEEPLDLPQELIQSILSVMT